MTSRVPRLMNSWADQLVLSQMSSPPGGEILCQNNSRITRGIDHKVTEITAFEGHLITSESDPGSEQESDRRKCECLCRLLCPGRITAANFELIFSSIFSLSLVVRTISRSDSPYCISELRQRRSPLRTSLSPPTSLLQPGKEGR